MNPPGPINKNVIIEGFYTQRVMRSTGIQIFSTLSLTDGAT
jgi:hypothetical protein